MNIFIDKSGFLDAFTHQVHKLLLRNNENR